jgi:hypothetical protein
MLLKGFTLTHKSISRNFPGVFGGHLVAMDIIIIRVKDGFYGCLLRVGGEFYANVIGVRSLPLFWSRCKDPGHAHVIYMKTFASCFVKGLPIIVKSQ